MENIGERLYCTCILVPNVVNSKLATLLPRLGYDQYGNGNGMGNNYMKELLIKSPIPIVH